MAYSISVYLDPKAALHSSFWERYFNQNPYLLEMADGYGAYAYTKPRFEDGDQRFLYFMEGVKETKQFVLDIHADSWSEPTPEFVKQKFHQYGFEDLASILRFEDETDLIELGEFNYTNAFKDEVGNFLLEPKKEFYPFDLKTLLEDWLQEYNLTLEGQTLTDSNKVKYYCTAPHFLNIGGWVCFYKEKPKDYFNK